MKYINRRLIPAPSFTRLLKVNSQNIIKKDVLLDRETSNLNFILIAL